MRSSPVSRYLLSASIAVACLLAGVHAAPAHASPVCVDPEGAIGGTGAMARAGSIGGTGSAQGAVGGTGRTAGAIGGTGAPQGTTGGTGVAQGAIGGTGQVAGAVGGIGAAQGAVGGTGQVAAGAVGGTGAPEGAIGGTGAKANGGIGGTGTPMVKGIGGTGIVGTITGFSSVCVNGLEVHLDEATSVDRNGKGYSAKRLAVGHVVAINAEGSPRGLRARSITVMHAVAGPVTAMDRAKGVIRVMNQPVRIGGATRIAGAGGMLQTDALRPGTLVSVSGQRNSRGEIMATRIEKDENLSDHTLIGRLRGKASDESADVSGTVVDALGGRYAGEAVLVHGRWTGSRLRANSIEMDPAVVAVRQAERAVVEGYVQRRGQNFVEVSGQSIALSPGVQYQKDGDGLTLDKRVVVSGRVDSEGRIGADRIEVQRNSGLDLSSGESRSGDSGSKDDDRSSGSNRSEDDPRSDETGDGSSSDNRGGSSSAADEVEHENNSGSSEKVERVDQVEKIEKADKVEKVERVDRADKVDRVEKVERVDRVDKVDRVEKVERVDRVETPASQRVERPDTSGRGRK